MLGFGAHLDPRVALLRAVTEMNQMLVPSLRRLRSRRRRDRTPRTRSGALAGDGDHREPALSAAAGGTAPCPRRRTPRAWADDVGDDVLRCQAWSSAGMEMLVLDQTRPRSACRSPR